MSPKKTFEEINRLFLEAARHSMILLLALTVSVLALATTAQAQDRPPIFQQMFKAYGFESFGQVEKIRYTFHLEVPGLNLSRSWEWEPKTDLISYEGKDSDGKPVKVTYSRSQLGSQSDVVKNEIDPAFSNDNYWLLLVLHFSWDGSATVTDEGTQKLPLGNGSAKRVVVKYPSEGGYAPGDTWELFVGADCAFQIWKRTPGDAWLARLLGLPVLRQLTRFSYDRFADLLYAWNRRKGHW